MLIIFAAMKILETLIVPVFGTTADTASGFILALALLALVATIVSEATVAVVFLLTRRKHENLQREIRDHYRASVNAVTADERSEFEARHIQANSLITRLMLMRAGVALVALWPVLVLLPRVQEWVAAAEAPFDSNVQAALVFVLLYFGVRMLVRPARRVIPVLRDVRGLHKDVAKRNRKMQKMQWR